MEHLISELEERLQQKLEVYYGEEIVVSTSISNPSELESFRMVFDNLTEAEQTIKTMINLNNETRQEFAVERVVSCYHS